MSSRHLVFSFSVRAAYAAALCVGLCMLLGASPRARACNDYHGVARAVAVAADGSSLWFHGSEGGGAEGSSRDIRVLDAVGRTVAILGGPGILADVGDLVADKKSRVPLATRLAKRLGMKLLRPDPKLALVVVKRETESECSRVYVRGGGVRGHLFTFETMGDMMRQCVDPGAKLLSASFPGDAVANSLVFFDYAFVSGAGGCETGVSYSFRTSRSRIEAVLAFAQAQRKPAKVAVLAEILAKDPGNLTLRHAIIEALAASGATAQEAKAVLNVDWPDSACGSWLIGGEFFDVDTPWSDDEDFKTWYPDYIQALNACYSDGMPRARYEVMRELDELRDAHVDESDLARLLRLDPGNLNIRERLTSVLIQRKASLQEAQALLGVPLSREVCGTGFIGHSFQDDEPLPSDGPFVRWRYAYDKRLRECYLGGRWTPPQ